MTGEPKKLTTVKTSVGLLWSAARKNGQAVFLQRGARGVQYLDCRTFSESQRLADWLPRPAAGDSDEQPAVSLMVGLDSSQVGFYVFEVPSVPEPQLTAIVRTQAEGCLPLPVSTMQLAWRVDAGQPADQCVLAAVRGEVYQNTLSRFSEAEVQSITPDVVGLIACWHACYQSSRQRTVVLSFGPHEAIGVLTEYGRILNTVRVDMDPEGPAQLLIADILQALSSLSPEIKETDVFLLESGLDRLPDLPEELKKEGFHVHRCGLDREKLKELGNPDPAVIDSSPEAFGLALLGLGEQSIDFDFTRQKIQPALTARQQVLSAPVLRAALSVAAAIVFLILGLYWKDKIELATLQKHLTNTGEGQTAQQLLQQMEYRRHVAQTRPDLMDLLGILRQTLPEGMMLDQFTFERGKPVELRGIAGSYEQAYEFQKNLQQCNDIRQVQLVEPTFDEKTKKVNFTLRFMYRNFSG